MGDQRTPSGPAMRRRPGGEEPRIEISWVETTQAVQAAPSSLRGNGGVERCDGVPLVAAKPLGIRLHPALHGPSERLLRGAVLHVARGSDSPPLPAIRRNGPIRMAPGCASDRARRDASLNFLLPGDALRGEVLLLSSVWTDDEHGPPLRAEAVTEIRPVEVQPLRIHLHPVMVWTRAGAIAPPPLAEAIETLAFSRRTFPVPDIEVSSVHPIEVHGIDRARLSSPEGWAPILLALERLRLARGTGDMEYGLLPRALHGGPIGGLALPPCAAASFSGEGSAMAQELGHLLGLRHAPGAGDPDPDPLFPIFAGLPVGSTGEHGFDPVTGEVFPAETSRDLMQNRPPFWVSPATYLALLRALEGREASDRPAASSTLAAAASSRRGGARDGGGGRIELRVLRPELASADRLLEGRLELEYEIACPPARDLAILLRYTADDGRSWVPLDPGRELGRTGVDLDALPGGEACRIEVIASSGSAWGSTTLGPFRTRERPRLAVIGGPEERTLGGRVVELSGGAFSAARAPGDQELVWRSSLEGEIGRGPVIVRSLAPGEHEISLEARDGRGGCARAAVRVVSVEESFEA